ncbi:MAG: sensor histidine kinase [Bacteroidia bacterium]
MNEHMDIVHINGSTSAFLEPSPGKPTFNLIKMARGTLGFELRNAILKVKTTQAPFKREGILLTNHNHSYTVSIEVLPLVETVDPHYLILFRKTELKAPLFKNEGNDNDIDKAAASRIEQLEKELAQAHEDMMSITAEQEKSNEELQSANEELLSGSEELQSLNEELETTKEEVQSTNEELIVVNQELLEKQEQLNRDRLFAEAIIQTLREPFVILDKDFRIKTAAAAFYTKFKLTEKETVGKLFYEISNGQWNDPFLKSMLEKILPKKSKLDDFELNIDFPLIGKCTMKLNARQIISDKTDEDLILLAIEDITEKKIAEERRKSFAEELETKVKERTIALEKINFELEQFSHAASHEFQEPLRKIVTFARLLQHFKDSDSKEKLNSYLSKIEMASLRMSSLIQDMLNFSNITTNKKLFEKTDLNQILKDIVFDFELLIDEKKVNITSDKLPVIEAVPFQVNQMFYDLIGNAIKFSKPGMTSEIHISASKLSREELKLQTELDPKLNYYKISFKDNGIGFDQKYAQQIFTMFQRLHETNSYAGTGIGLALCKKIVQNYHGAIYAEGKPNEGATFHVILPEKQPRKTLEIPFK